MHHSIALPRLCDERFRASSSAPSIQEEAEEIYLTFNTAFDEIEAHVKNQRLELESLSAALKDAQEKLTKLQTELDAANTSQGAAATESQEELRKQVTGLQELLRMMQGMLTRTVEFNDRLKTAATPPTPPPAPEQTTPQTRNTEAVERARARRGSPTTRINPT